MKQKPDTLLDLLSAGIQFVLMVAGIIGVATLLFSEDGLVPLMGKKLTEIDSFAPLLMLPLAFVAIYVARAWFERTFAKSSSAAIATLAMYVMMAIGAFFLIRLIGTGSFTG